MRTAMMRATTSLVISGAKNQLAYLGAFIVKNLFLLVILYTFQALWRTVYGTRELIGAYSLTQVVWYLIVTEGIVFGRSALWQTVQDEVKDGTVAYGLARPIPYPRLTMSRFIGEGLIRLFPTIALGAIVGLAAVGPLPNLLQGLFAALPLMIGSLVLMAQMDMLVGLIAFSLEEVSPVYWLVQKSMFFLGGLFFPLDLYPPLLAAVLKWGPFASMAYWPARVAVHGGEGFLSALANLVVWIVIGAAAVSLVHARALKSVQSQGG